MKIIPDGSRVIRMNEKDLIPFDWEEYKAGDGVYYYHIRGSEYALGRGHLKRVEVFNGYVGYENIDNDVFDRLELRLPRQINKERIGSSFDDFMKEDIQE